jgi:hypothetical protein
MNMPPGGGLGFVLIAIAAEGESVSLLGFTSDMLCARLFDRLVVGFLKEWTRLL